MHTILRPKNLLEMIVVGGYERTAHAIHDDFFHVDPSLFRTDGVEPMPVEGMTTREIEERIRACNRQPAPLEALLAYGAAHPDVPTLHGCIATLVRSPYPGYQEYVPQIERDGAGRALRLCHAVADTRWSFSVVLTVPLSG